MTHLNIRFPLDFWFFFTLFTDILVYFCHFFVLVCFYFLYFFKAISLIRINKLINTLNIIFILCIIPLYSWNKLSVRSFLHFLKSAIWFFKSKLIHFYIFMRCFSVVFENRICYLRFHLEGACWFPVFWRFFVFWDWY